CVLETFGVTEQRTAGNEHVGTGADGAGNRCRTDAAVDLDVEVVPACFAHGPQRRHLGFHRGDVRLTTEARVDRHDEDEVDVVEHPLDVGQRGVRIERYGGRRSRVADVAERAVQMAARLFVHDHDV